MSAIRSPYNPIISPKDVKPSRDDFEVLCAFNAGVSRFHEDIILLLRIAEKPINPNPDQVDLVPILDTQSKQIVIKEFSKKDSNIDFSDSRFVRTQSEQFLTSISHLRLARSKDGIHFEIEETPAMFPENEYEIYGIEDPRITFMDGIYYINYSSISPFGVVTWLASTEDFKNYQRHGIIFPPDNKDVALFPSKVNEKYYALHRASSGEYDKRELWIAESPDLVCWGNHRRVMGIRDGYWDNSRIGGSAVPFQIDDGWLEIYHGASKEDRYCLGAVLLDKDEPWKVLARSEKPIIEPQEDYEINGFFGNVIFNCGVLFENNIVKIYYGAADTYVAYAEISLNEIFNTMQ